MIKIASAALIEFVCETKTIFLCRMDILFLMKNVVFFLRKALLSSPIVCTIITE